MPKNERNQNGRSNVRVLHFPASSPMPAPMDGDADALADSIRKAWTQKPSATKQLYRFRCWIAAPGGRKNLSFRDLYLPAYISLAFSPNSFVWLGSESTTRMLSQS